LIVHNDWLIKGLYWLELDIFKVFIWGESSRY
jgi:hypothetical protein